MEGKMCLALFTRDTSEKVYAQTESAYLVAELLGGCLQQQHLFRNPGQAAEYISRTGRLWQGESFPVFMGLSASVYFDRVLQWVVDKDYREYDGVEFIVKHIYLSQHRADGSAVEVES
jgi:hypothetical protein